MKISSYMLDKIELCFEESCRQYDSLEVFALTVYNQWFSESNWSLLVLGLFSGL